MKRINILRKARKRLRREITPGICAAILKVLYEENYKSDNLKIKDVYKLFPLLTKNNAERFRSEEDYIYDIYWWRPYEFNKLFSGRRRFMRWLIKQYKNDKEEII